jgi:hypothetical protein
VNCFSFKHVHHLTIRTALLKDGKAYVQARVAAG